MHSISDYSILISKFVFPKLKKCTKLLNKEFKLYNSNFDITIHPPEIKSLNKFYNNGNIDKSIEFIFPFYIDEEEIMSYYDVIDSIFKIILNENIEDILKYSKKSKESLPSIQHISSDKFNYYFEINFEQNKIDNLITKYKLECLI